MPKLNAYDKENKEMLKKFIQVDDKMADLQESIQKIPRTSSTNVNTVTVPSGVSEAKLQRE